ncbi:galactose ABC transporter substrate-binding protein [Clostridium cellulovorans]|uniref:D-galactose/methyl-galactoside binding periplasmic protein MglB n=1 Tax=Clostridium cellulovorans (strain ATCC 35296 / DSM 3052 / OCM 3 / 743B) TaxID=573061 RepID=D9SKT7_CLOC7|nr:galactose ABC transporter substrate-binding protein [Clostridium cellulovorans]ADL53509.1 putative galactoside ABC transporter [Clostridium cellulovorans 743B]
MKNSKSTRVYLIVFIALVIITFFIVSMNRNIFMEIGYKDGFPKIGAVIYKYDDTFISYVSESMEETSFGKAALNVQDSQNDQSRQFQQIDEMIDDKVRVLVVNLVEPTAAETIINKAKNAEVPVIFFNKEPEASVLKSYSNAWYVGADSSEAGILQGKMIAKLWRKNLQWDKDKDGILSYVLLKGEPGHPDAEIRAKYVIDEIKNSGIQVRELDSHYAMWDEVRARGKMDQWIAQFGNNIEFVISNNDTMAIGAINSLEKNGYMSGDNFVPVVGVDAIQEAIQEITEGKMVGTVLNDAKKQGAAVINLAINASKGDDILKGTAFVMGSDKSVRVPYVAITKDNLDVAKEAYKY